LPEPAWTLADYATQCQNDQEHTAGALVLYDIENDSGSFSWLLFQNTYAHLYAKAVLISCSSGFSLGERNPRTIETMSISSVVNAGGPHGTATATTNQTTTKGKIGEPDTTMTSVSSPPPYVVTRTATETAVPKMDIVWQNTDMLSGYRLQRSVPFLAFAGLATYLATRYTVPTTTTVATSAPSAGATGGTVTTTTGRTYNGATDLPLSLALLGQTVGGLNTSTLGGANQTRILKNAAAALAMRLVNILADECYPNPAAAVPQCRNIESLHVFNLSAVNDFSSVVKRANATKP
jgi:hypothetical protein